MACISNQQRHSSIFFCRYQPLIVLGDSRERAFSSTSAPQAASPSISSSIPTSWVAQNPVFPWILLLLTPQTPLHDDIYGQSCVTRANRPSSERAGPQDRECLHVTSLSNTRMLKNVSNIDANAYFTSVSYCKQVPQNS